MRDKKTLKDIIDQIKTKSDNVITDAGEIQKAGNFARELAEVSINNFDNSPMHDNPSVYISDFQSVLDGLCKIQTHMGAMASLASGITYGTASTMTTLSGTLTPPSYRANPSYAQFYVQFDQIIDRGQTKDQAIFEIKKLGLDSVAEGNEAIVPLNSAWETHLSGLAISTSTLIPLRESIAKVLNAIRIKIPPPQLKFTKTRIIDIGTRVAFSHITATQLQDLQNEHEALRDQLSGSKSGTYTKETEKNLLREGTLHLIKILSFVDPSKLR